MYFILDDKILNTIPTFKIGINHYTKITVSDAPQMIKGRLQLFQEQLFFELENKAVTDYKGVQEWRSIWRSFRADPSRYRPSHEALLRRIHKQNYIPSVNSAVDINNFFSLQYRIPMGIYDMDLIKANVRFEIGGEETSYEGLNGRINHLANIIVISDSIGAFGSPYVDAKRTAVTKETNSLLQVFFLRPSMEIEEASELINAAANMFTSIHGGNVSTNLLHSEQPSIKVNL